MKKLFTLAFVAFSVIAASAQYCRTDKGTVLEYATVATSEDGKAIESTVTATVIDVATAADGIVSVKTEEVSPIPGSDFGKITEYAYATYNPADTTTVVIIAGEEDSKASVVNLLKTSFEAAGQTLSDSQIKELEESIKVKGELKLSLKPDIAAGTKIANQTLRLSFGPETMVMNLWEAKYDGYETVKVPAGDFECIKIVYVQNVKMGTNKQKSYITAWYAPGVGLVRSVSADKKGTETSRTDVSHIKKP